jgi:hypothetical protein
MGYLVLLCSFTESASRMDVSSSTNNCSRYLDGEEKRAGRAGADPMLSHRVWELVSRHIFERPET